MYSDKEKRVMLAMLAAIVGAIADLEPQGVPSGHLYATLMVGFPNITLNAYHSITDSLKGLGLITETSHLLHVTLKGRQFAAAIGSR